MIKLRFASPEMLVDINELPGLDYLRRDDDGTLHIGALCRHGALERSSLLATHQPTMAAAAPLVADPIVRIRGTLVGSLCHADPQGDWASVMTSLDGLVVAEGPKGRRTILVKEFVLGPFQNALAVDEIVVEAVVPAPQGVPAGGYLKLERRVGDFATAGVGRFGTRRLVGADVEGESLLLHPLQPTLGHRVVEREPLTRQVVGMAHVDHPIFLGLGHRIGFVGDGEHCRQRRRRPTGKHTRALEGIARQ